MKLKYVGWLVAACVAIGLFAWWMGSSKEESQQKDSLKRLSVVTTLFPLYDFSKAIGGEYVDVTLLLPPGVESHSFEPKPSDMVRIDQSDIFAYTGNAMEPWAEDVIKGSSNKNLKVVDSSVGIQMIPGVFHDADEPAGSMDPHIWLDFDNAAMMVSSLEKTFIEKDPTHAEVYKKNAEAYRARLSSLDKEYATGLESCSTKQIVYGGHYAFGYLAHRYGLEYVAAQGLAPDAEPSAKDIALLVDQIKKNGIKFVFYEELTSPKIAEALSNETGAKMLFLNAAHNIAKDDYVKGTTFFGIMGENLVSLREGLGCK